MNADAFLPNQITSVNTYVRRLKASWLIMYLGLLGISGLVSLMMARGNPSWSMIAWIIYWVGIIAIFYNPRYGVYLIIGLTLMGDQVLTYWYPFQKNFSSGESILFLSSSVNLSPLESYQIFTIFSWFGRMAMERRFRFRTGPLFWPAILFGFFITVGLFYGLMRGGALKIALWEVRVIYYLPIMLIITGNLIETRAHVDRLVWIIALALFYKGIMAVVHVATVLQWDIGSVEQIAEHSMSIQFNAFFILVVVSWFYHDTTFRRLVWTSWTPILLYGFFANHRRAGFLTLILGIGIVLTMLYRENRKLFFTLAPTGLVIFLLYLAIFWNNMGSIGIIARAVRSVVGQPTARDAASNIYRELEDMNSIFNIRNSPLFGVGFGNKFIIVAPMPDISFFEWWEYITHNSIMWIWMDAGIGAFFSMLLLAGMTMIVGGRTIWNAPYGPMRGVALMATLYIFMHFTYAYADMSWEAISMMFVGSMMGLINSLELIISRPLPEQIKRWPWVPDRDASPKKRWPWIPDKGVLPPHREPRQLPAPLPAYRVAQQTQAATKQARHSS